MSHSHSHSPHLHNERALLIVIALNLAFVVLEFMAGWWANSAALSADATHNLSDVLGLVLAWSASLLARRAASARFTYGLRSSSILAALTNAVLLFVACGALGWEALQRLQQAPAVASNIVISVAAMGIVINGVSAWLLGHGHSHDLNLRAAYWHMVGDAAVSLGVVITGLVLKFTGWYWLDPLTSLAIVLFILLGTWGLLRDAIKMTLNAAPSHIDSAAVAHYLRHYPGVDAVYDLHIWNMSTTESALTAHLVMSGGHPGDAVLADISAALKQSFGIPHSTLQIEQQALAGACSPNATCYLSQPLTH